MRYIKTDGCMMDSWEEEPCDCTKNTTQLKGTVLRNATGGEICENERTIPCNPSTG